MASVAEAALEVLDLKEVSVRGGEGLSAAWLQSFQEA
jgi:hypothetical protein